MCIDKVYVAYETENTEILNVLGIYTTYQLALNCCEEQFDARCFDITEERDMFENDYSIYSFNVDSELVNSGTIYKQNLIEKYNPNKQANYLIKDQHIKLGDTIINEKGIKGIVDNIVVHDENNIYIEFENGNNDLISNVKRVS